MKDIQIQLIIPIRELIIGNGIAGLSPAEAARRNNPEIPITIISKDDKLTIIGCDLVIKQWHGK